MFYKRAEKKKLLDEKIKACHKCAGLNIKNQTENACGYGNLMSEVFIIGQSLCTYCMQTQIPFSRGSGDILDYAFEKIGKTKADFFITNILHCHPPKNRASTNEEISNCLGFLRKELSIVKPSIIITLGNDASETIIEELDVPYKATFQKGIPLPFQPFWKTTKKEHYVITFPHPAHLLYSGNDEKKINQYVKNLSSALLFRGNWYEKP